MSEPCLVYENVSAYYHQIQALHGVSLNIFPKEIVTLIGANGAGKSTLLMSLFGVPTRLAGRITYEGEAIQALAPHRLAERGIAIAPEGRRIFQKLTVLENLWMGAYAIGQPCSKTLATIFDWFPKLFDRQQQVAGTLSGGEQQMLAIGRALMSQPRLLLLDEPSLGLAPKITHDIFNRCRDIAASGTTIFLVEQNAKQALLLANRGYVMANGHITQEGDASTLLTCPSVQQAYLGGSAS